MGPCRLESLIKIHMTRLSRVLIIATAILLFAINSLSSQPRRYPVAFYNLENLFDTIDTPNVVDEEFTPSGPYQWGSQRYYKKLSNIEEVFYRLSQATGSFPAVIGMSELENRNVLEDIVSLPKLVKANYQIVHYDSPDVRGVDVALIYRPSVFNYEGSSSLRVKVEGRPDFKTRDILMTWGTIDGEKFYFFVCHWPSRRGGEQTSEPLRCAAAKVARDAIDSVVKIDPKASFILMGDLNDDPVNRSIYEVLGAKGKMSEAKNPGDMFNPFHAMFKAGYGSLAYQDSWNLFDNITVSYNLINNPKQKVVLAKSDNNKFWGNIFNRSFLTQQSGQYKNYPLRTFVGTNFQGGYSDHFPVFIYLLSKQ